MRIKARLSVNFEEDLPRERIAKFFHTLRRDGWEKSPDAEDTWNAVFKTGVTNDSAMNVVKHDVDRAAKKAEIIQFNACIQFGDNPVESFGPFYVPENLRDQANHESDS